MELKIYFGDKTVYLCDSLSNVLLELNKHPDVVLVNDASPHAIQALLQEIKKDNFYAGIMVHHDFNVLKDRFFDCFNCIEAAGGITLNKEKELLFIFRRGKWDLPKGKMEQDEVPAACAMREIEEETGIKGLNIISKLGETYHSYHEFGKEILKTNHWFLLETESEDIPAGQTEEDISEARWVKESDLGTIFNNTYPSIKDVLKIFLQLPR